MVEELADSDRWLCRVCGKKWRHSTDDGKPLPYHWGKFQGWLLIIVAPFAILYNAHVLINAQTAQARGEAMAGVLLSLLNILMGIGILRKKHYGLVLVYVVLGIFILAVGVALVAFPREAMIRGLGSLFVWTLYTWYYYKRRHELRHGAGGADVRR